MNLSQFSATNVIIGASCLALLWALLQFLIVARIPVETAGSSSEESGLVSGNDENNNQNVRGGTRLLEFQRTGVANA